MTYDQPCARTGTAQIPPATPPGRVNGCVAWTGPPPTTDSGAFAHLRARFPLLGHAFTSVARHPTMWGGTEMRDRWAATQSFET